MRRFYACVSVLLSDGTFLEFDRGKIDDYCVYVRAPSGERYAPSDVDYFFDLRLLASRHGFEKVWSDFESLYEGVTSEIDSNVFKYIDSAVLKYERDQALAQKTFYLLYAGMIAEIYKSNTKLGKRIKKLGVHSLLVEKKSLEYSTNFMRNMNWREIDAICRERGF